MAIPLPGVWVKTPGAVIDFWGDPVLISAHLLAGMGEQGSSDPIIKRGYP